MGLRDERVDVLLGYYRTMVLIRRFETRLEQIFLEGIVRGTCHPCVGQEATAVGTCAALRPEDKVVSTHRGHGHFIAKGGDPKRLMAEMFGKVDGYSGGRGGSQHMACFEISFLGSNGITGGGIPIATGVGLAIQLQERDEIVVSFFGDGAANQGTFHESLNMAAIWKLPVVYVCENNMYAMSTPFCEAFAVADIARRGDAYGIPWRIVDGNDVLTVRNAVSEAAEHARSGGGPMLVECKTYRFCGHSRGDPRLYRSREEEAEWMARCPIVTFRKRLIDQGIASEEQLAEIEVDAHEEIAEAEQFARNSPDPDPATVEEGLFA